MGSKTWKQMRTTHRPQTQALYESRRPRRAPLLARLVGLLWPSVPRRWLEMKLRAHEHKVKHAAKKALHAERERGES